MSKTASGSELRERGVQAYRFFHNEALKYPQNYKISFETALDQITAYSPNFFQSFGRILQVSVETQGMNESEVRNRMESLARKSKGLFPEKPTEFMRAFQFPESEVTWTASKSIKTVFQSLPSAIADSVVLVGNSVETGLKVGAYAVPLVIAGVIGFVLLGKMKAV